MRSAWVVCACLAAAAAAAAGAAGAGEPRRGDADFEFDEDAARGAGRAERARRPRTYVYDPHSPACREVTCARRETCLLVRPSARAPARAPAAAAALCADKRAVLRAGDVIVSASGAGARGDGDDDVFYEAPAGAGAGGGAGGGAAGAEDGPEPAADRCVGCGAGAGGGGGARAQFVCGSDNRTYSSLCRLDLHNCVRRARVAAACRGFCPCRARRRDADRDDDDEWWRHGGGGGGGGGHGRGRARAHNDVLPPARRLDRDRTKRRRLFKEGAGAGCELDKMADRLLDWFSVVMDEARAAPPPPPPAAGFPRECKPEVRWMFAHLDADGDGLLSADNLYALRHDEREQCLRPFLASCGGGGAAAAAGAGGVTRGAWCACLRRAARPCTALARAHPGGGARSGLYVPACDARGYYLPRQCHAALGVCWCVTRHGAERPGSRTRGAPACPPAHDDVVAGGAGGGAPPADDEDALGAEAEAEAEAGGGSGDAELRF